jgi:hypothetical protein
VTSNDDTQNSNESKISPSEHLEKLFMNRILGQTEYILGDVQQYPHISEFTNDDDVIAIADPTVKDPFEVRIVRNEGDETPSILLTFEDALTDNQAQIMVEPGVFIAGVVNLLRSNLSVAGAVIASIEVLEAMKEMTKTEEN